MKKRIQHLGMFVLVALAVCRPATAEDNGGATTNRHLLWKVEGKSNVVYLLGSIHLLKPEDFPLPGPLESAFSNAQVAVFEADEEKMSEPEVRAQLMTKAKLPDGETLKQRLSAETYDAFVSRVKADGLPAEAFDTIRPAMAAMALAMIEIQKVGVDPEHGVDKYFSDQARKEGKESIFLETLDFQMDLLTSFGKDEEEQLMKTSLKEMDRVKEEYDKMVKAWQTGDSAALEKMLNESLRDAPSLYKRLVTDRNNNWLPKIGEFLRSDKNTIVIVGAAHLAGSDGVVEMLKKKGLKVTQL